jgi:hypothetical protein
MKSAGGSFPHVSPPVEMGERNGKRETIEKLFQNKYNNMLNIVEVMASMMMSSTKDPKHAAEFEDLKSLVAQARNKIK